MKFALTGAAGYIAPRHYKAIADTGNELVAALDPHDSVGILDSYFPNASYFREFERFDRHLERLKHINDGVDYVSICSPNHLHDAHIRAALRLGANAICEKPMVLNPWNCDALLEIEQKSGRKINTVLQLRSHPSIIELRKKWAQTNECHDIDLTYITSRGNWYLYSWKGELEKSGGLATNIGIHFFDMLMWIFGPVQHMQVDMNQKTKVSGTLYLERAKVKWFLSIDAHDLPKTAIENNMKTWRSIKIDGEEIEFSGGFTDLHTRVYENIIAGNGFGVADAKPSIDLVHTIRNY